VRQYPSGLEFFQRDESGGTCILQIDQYFCSRDSKSQSGRSVTVLGGQVAGNLLQRNRVFAKPALGERCMNMHALDLKYSLR
jgi:hypothetical protein